MIPILFSHNTTSFTTHGIGDLMETVACESIVNSEGEYELELQYPADGPMIPYLLINNIVVAKVNDHGSYQAFRIYGISKAINRLVTVKCQHISYDLSCAPVMHYEATTCSSALSELKNHAVGDIVNPFSFYTDIPDSQKPLNQDEKFKLEEASTVRAALLDGDDSIYGCWEGDLVFDNFTVKFLKLGSSDVDAGKDRGVLIEYGIDMMDMEQEENISEMITGVLPYWKGKEEGDEADADDKIVYGSVQYASGTFQRQRVVPLNVTEYYPNNTSAPTMAEIEKTARDWMTANKVGEPVLNLTISYAELKEDVRLHDAVTVRFVKIGIDVKAKVISYKYDVLKERCIEVEVGNVKPSILFSLEDASRLKRGLIPPKRIANNSITSDHIENYGISGSNLGTSSVGTRSIAESAVTEQKIGQWAVTTDKINGLAVTSAKIQNGAVGNVQLATAAVTHDKIGSGEIYEANLGDLAVSSTKIKEGAVISWKDQYGVTHSHVAPSTIYADSVQEMAINTVHIGNSAITSVKIKEGNVIEGNIGNEAISYPKVKDANIDQLALNDYSVTSSKITVEGSHRHYDRASGQMIWVNDEPGVESGSIKNDAVISTKIGEQQISTTHWNYELQRWQTDIDDDVATVLGLLEFDTAQGVKLSVGVVDCSNAFNFGGHWISDGPKAQGSSFVPIGYYSN